MKHALALLLASAACALFLPAEAHAFCGFFVAKADSKLFNEASQVVLVRDDDRTVITMSNDFQGDPQEFAMVIPVPTFISREQIHIAERAILDHIDAYTAPRLVEYTDPDPCQTVMHDMLFKSAAPSASGAAREVRANSLGVRIEAQYTVGEYDILILSAEQSNGLETWLRSEGYRIPDGASEVLGSYLKQNMKFFVARVNLSERARLGFTYLRPISVAYQSPKFMLPIRLGTVNAHGPQELFVYTITRRGRVETTNYRTVKLPTGMDLPEYVKGEFAPFYRSMFAKQVRDQDMKAVFLEYAWDMSWCDPCAADPLSADELRQLGVFWLDTPAPDPAGANGFRRPGPVPRPPASGLDAFVTRLHVRYDGTHFPEDLVFQATGDRENFQGRYVLRHAFTGSLECEAGREYRRSLRERRNAEASALAALTGWDLEEVRRKAGASSTTVSNPDEPWYESLWRQ